MMQFPFGTMRRYLDYDLEPYANVLGWLARIEERPAFRKAIALAGPGREALSQRSDLLRACCASAACSVAYAWCAAASASPTRIERPMSISTEPSAERHSITLSGRHE
jgi:anti-sigma-K factor RskA